MALQVSIRAKESFLTSFNDLFDGGVIRIFSGSQPTTSNDAETGVLLGSITRNGVPVSLGPYAGLAYTQTGPYVLHTTDFLFGLTAIATGAASWFRIVGPAPDDGGPSITLPRIDGSISGVGDGGQLELPSTSLESGDLIIPISFFFTIPPV